LAGTRRSLSLRAPPDLGRFWRGIVYGLAAQLAWLAVGGTLVQSWVALLSVGSTSIVVFFLARAILRSLSPEEELLLQRLAARQRRAGKL
jgi:hypothetical protein